MCLLLRPFLPVLAFALALAVITHPLHRAVKRRVRWPDLAAGLAVAAVGLLVVTPIILVGRTLVVQVAAGIKTLQAEVQSGHWREAVALVAWGAIAIGLIDNVLYPLLVRTRMRLHTLPVFFAILGGIALFGAAGVVVGPLILSITDALIDIWRRRTAHGRAADTAVE